jgi:hypothetical protein
VKLAARAPVRIAMSVFCAYGIAIAADATAASGAGRLAPGTWGGDRVQLTVTEQGATIEYDCGHGTIDEPVTTDARGRFAAKGTHVFEHGGPAREDEPDSRHAARYQGRVEGDAMDLTVTIVDSQREVGAFTLKRGVYTRLHKCL